MNDWKQVYETIIVDKKDILNRKAKPLTKWSLWKRFKTRLGDKWWLIRRDLANFIFDMDNY